MERRFWASIVLGFVSIALLAGLLAGWGVGADRSVYAQGGTPLFPTNTPLDASPALPTATNEPVAPLATPTVLYPLNPEPGLVLGGTAVPTAMPLLVQRDREGTPYELLNFLLLGHDSDSIEQADDVFRTDTMIIVSVNLTTNTVSMMSLPRDLYVYIPGWTMQRLNLAFGHGKAVGWTDGGFGLLRQTILYNFGIRIHYYAMVDFAGFKRIIDTLDGVTIPVDCPIQDYRFTNTYDDEGNPVFEFVTLPVGVHDMDSTTALFYARSRKNSSDFDRGRRQQQLLRAIWRDSLEGDYLNNIPQLYSDLTEIVETNIPLDVMIQLAPLALSMEPNQVENHFFRLGYETQPWTAPDGSNVQLPQLAIIDTIRAFLSPPTENQLVTDSARIGIYDVSGTDSQLDVVATERLIWEGLYPRAMGKAELPDGHDEGTILVDYTGGSSKGSSVRRIAQTLNIQRDYIDIVLDASTEMDVEVYIDSDYSSCVDRDVTEPVEATPTPAS